MPRIAAPVALAASVALIAAAAGCASNANPSATSSYALHADAQGPNNLAIDGYDPVSYFPEAQGSPTKGKPDISANHNGLTYRFANRTNRNRFLNNPDAYLPAHGGWCSYAVAESSQKVDADPTNYIIRDGRLFLFYRDNSVDTKDLWLDNGHDNYIDKADHNWEQITG